jgi:hypothetical protein
MKRVLIIGASGDDGTALLRNLAGRGRCRTGSGSRQLLRRQRRPTKPTWTRRRSTGRRAAAGFRQVALGKTCRSLRTRSAPFTRSPASCRTRQARLRPALALSRSGRPALRVPAAPAGRGAPEPGAWSTLVHLLLHGIVKGFAFAGHPGADGLAVAAPEIGVASPDHQRLGSREQGCQAPRGHVLVDTPEPIAERRRTSGGCITVWSCGDVAAG